MIYKNESGFTLIEVLIAMAILAIGLLGIGMMQAYFAEGNANSRQLIRATDIATAKIEELGNLDPGDADLDTTANPHKDTIEKYPLSYDLEWNVTKADTETETDQVLDIDLTVSWDQGGQAHNLNFHWIREN